MLTFVILLLWCRYTINEKKKKIDCLKKWFLLVYKEVDFFVRSVCKAVGEICSMWIRIFNFIFYVDVDTQFIFFCFILRNFVCELFVR